MSAGTPRRRARPVADAPIDDLLGETSELAKRWLIALLDQSELDGASAILAGQLTVDGPSLCGAVLRALADDHELSRLEPDGAEAALAGRAAQLGGATTPVGAVRAVEALRQTVWAALREALRRPVPDQVAELAQRLALVCETVLVASLKGLAVAPTDVKPLQVEPLQEPAPPPNATPARSGPLWVAALEEEIRHADGSPLSLLLAELEDAEQILAAEGSDAATITFELFAHAMRGVVRGQDILVRETDARTWIIARGTGRTGAVSLGRRVAEAVTSARRRGAPLTATVGLAVLGEDGTTSVELIEAAEEGRFAASASGTDVAR